MAWNRTLSLTAIVLAVLLCGPAGAAEPMERPAALALSRSVDTGSVRQALLGDTISGNTPAVLDLLERTAQRTDWPPAAVDTLLRDFVQDIRDLPRASVPHEVLAWLSAYEPRAWVVHEDHPAALVPLFNIRAMAVGLENDWRRQDALLEGLALMAANPRSLVDAWLIEQHPASRLGYLQALGQASPEQLSGVSRHARLRLQQHPELTALAGQAALRGGDVPALGEVLVMGDGPDLTPLMRDAARQLPAESSAALLGSTLENGSGISPVLAIAELAPAASGLPSTQQLLIAQLDDQRLGPTAALALARVATPESVSTLQRLAKGKTGTTSRLAQLALELRNTDTPGAPPE